MPRPAPAAKKRSPLTPLYLLLGLIVVAGAGVLFTQTRRAAGDAAKAPVAVNISPAELQRLPGMSIGRPDAPLTILEFADFQCPGCQGWATFMEPLIKERLVNTGRARYVFYDFPLAMHKNGFIASRAGRCANEQGKFWEYHAALFQNQGKWAFEEDAVPLFLQYAEGVGADEDRFEECIRSEKFAREVSESVKLGESLGVAGTPTIFVNGQRLQDMPRDYSQFAAELEKIAPGSTGAAAPAGAAPAADS
ncbi:MAG: DsbA family protein, partial [Acetobacteraceae bacterium]|nr:DsbA family protein [Acetobacteraceae bacterium]